MKNYAAAKAQILRDLKTNTGILVTLRIMKGAKKPLVANQSPQPVLPPMIQKMLDDQQAVHAYIRDELTLEDLHARGIKFSK